MKRRSIIRWLVAACALIVFIWVFFPPALPWDIVADRPRDVARKFVEAVRAGDFSSARSAWERESVTNAERNSGRTFEEFCRDRFLCDRYTVRPMGVGKSGMCVVGFEGDGREGKKTYSIYLERISGRWRIVEDLIYPVLERQSSK